MLNEKEQELIEIIYDLNQKGISPMYSDIMSRSTQHPSTYNKTRLANLVRRGYLQLNGRRYYAPMTISGMNNTNIDIKEAVFEQLAKDDYCIWFILALARYNRPGLTQMRDELIKHIDIEQMQRRFTLLYLIKLMHENVASIPSVEVMMTFHDERESWDKFLAQLGFTLTVKGDADNG